LQYQCLHVVRAEIFARLPVHGTETVKGTRHVSNLGDASVGESFADIGLRSAEQNVQTVDFGSGIGTDLLSGDEADWHERALCAQTDPEAFFPEKGGSTREAKKICTGCEVRSECLSYALTNDERFGIWGGLSERERRRLKRSAG
jgi:WhiB family redox-sensing transcriptional regulator